jgi:hypothetical protein
MDSEANMTEKPECGEISRQIFERFIARLEDNQETSELVERLRKVIITDGALGERELREAMFPSENQS